MPSRMDPPSHSKRSLPARGIPVETGSPWARTPNALTGRVTGVTVAGEEAKVAQPTDERRAPGCAEGAEADGSPFPAQLGSRIALLLCGAFLLGMGMVAAVLWATAGYFEDMPISGAPLVAALLGGGGAMAVGAGLMAALFHSNRSGWDERAK